jgi:hypothetical protein
MVTEQIIAAAGRAAAAAGTPGPGPNNTGASELSRLGAAAQLYAVKTNCTCPSCQALRKMADLTMSAVLEVSLEQAAAGPAEDAPAPQPITGEVIAGAPGDDPPA